MGHPELTYSGLRLDRKPKFNKKRKDWRLRPRIWLCFGFSVQRFWTPSGSDFMQLDLVATPLTLWTRLGCSRHEQDPMEWTSKECGTQAVESQILTSAWTPLSLTGLRSEVHIRFRLLCIRAQDSQQIMQLITGTRGQPYPYIVWIPLNALFYVNQFLSCFSPYKKVFVASIFPGTPKH